MNRRALIIIIISVIAVSLISGIVVLAVSHKKHSEAAATSSEDSDFTYVSPALIEDEETEAEIKKEIETFVPATEMDLDPTSITVYVNKEYALPKDYKPEKLVTPNIRFDITYYDERTLMRPEASKALEKLFAAAEKSGIYLSGVSGYRSYDRQYKIFTNNIATKGKEHTLLYSAVPGTSEHQTGLSIDVSSDSINNKLSDEFADTPEGIWLAENSYLYGYIIRYPKDMATITGYAYEPWHIRYVGRPLAYYLYENKLTLDEYYKYTPSPDFDFETLYADLINYVAPTVTVTMTPTPSVTPTPTPTPAKGKGKKDKDKKNDDDKKDGNLDAIISATPVPTPEVGSGETGGNDPNISGIPDEGDSNVDPSNSDGSEVSIPPINDGSSIIGGSDGTTDIIIE